MTKAMSKSAEAMQKLQLGNLLHLTKREKHTIISDNLDEFKNSQSPYAVVLSCSDSRVVPESIFNVGPGEIFVVRVAGNIATPHTIASIEFAVAKLGVALIIVLSHENCGAVMAAMEGRDAGPNLNEVIRHIQPAIEKSEHKSLLQIIRTNARLNTEKILKDSELISTALEKNEVEIKTAYYNLETGVVDFF